MCFQADAYDLFAVHHGSVDSSHGTHTVEQAPFNLGFIKVYATDNRSSEGLYMPMFTSMTA